MQIKITGGIIRVDGVQYGTTYSNHNLAVNIATQIQAKHYPHATLIDVPDVPDVPDIPLSHHAPKTRKNNLVLA